MLKICKWKLNKTMRNTWCNWKSEAVALQLKYKWKIKIVEMYWNWNSVQQKSTDESSCWMQILHILPDEVSGLYFLIERMIRNKQKQSSEDVLPNILDILKNFGIFTNKVAGLWIFHNFSEQFFYRTSPVVASGNTTGFLFFANI